MPCWPFKWSVNSAFHLNFASQCLYVHLNFHNDMCIILCLISSLQNTNLLSQPVQDHFPSDVWKAFSWTLLFTAFENIAQVMLLLHISLPWFRTQCAFNSFCCLNVSVQKPQWNFWATTFFELACFNLKLFTCSTPAFKSYFFELESLLSFLLLALSLVLSTMSKVSFPKNMPCNFFHASCCHLLSHFFIGTTVCFVALLLESARFLLWHKSDSLSLYDVCQEEPLPKQVLYECVAYSVFCFAAHSAHCLDILMPFCFSGISSVNTKLPFPRYAKTTIQYQHHSVCMSTT